MSGSATAGAAAGTYDITVSSLAAKQSLASTATCINLGGGGNGKTDHHLWYHGLQLQLRHLYVIYSEVRNVPGDITIDSSNNTLAGVRDAINASERQCVCIDSLRRE